MKAVALILAAVWFLSVASAAVAGPGCSGTYEEVKKPSTGV